MCEVDSAFRFSRAIKTAPLNKGTSQYWVQTTWPKRQNILLLQLQLLSRSCNMCRARLSLSRSGWPDCSALKFWFLAAGAACFTSRIFPSATWPTAIKIITTSPTCLLAARGPSLTNKPYTFQQLKTLYNKSKNIFVLLLFRIQNVDLVRSNFPSYLSFWLQF